MSTWGLRWLALFALWLAFTDSRALPEVIAGTVAAALGATLTSMVVRPGRPQTLRMTARLLRSPLRLAAPLARLVLDIRPLGEALWLRLVRRQRVRGNLRSARLPADPALHSAAGRVAVEAWGSLTPNRIVIGIDDEAGAILVHELIRSGAPINPIAGR